MTVFSFLIAFVLLNSAINVSVAIITTRSSKLWINEFHYDNEDGDTGEFIEIVGVNTIDASNYEIHVYNGVSSDSTAVHRYGLSLSDFNVSTIGDYNIYVYDIPQTSALKLQNDDEAIALIQIQPAAVLEFISYEFDSFPGLAAEGGPAIVIGKLAEDIGAFQNGAVGSTVGLTGNGQDNFVWTTPDRSKGTLNPGQVLDSPTENEDQAMIIAVSLLSAVIVLSAVAFALYRRKSKLVVKTASEAVPVAAESEEAAPVQHFLARVERVETGAEIDSDIEIVDAYRNSEAYRNIKLDHEQGGLMFDETLVDEEESEDEDRIYVKQKSNPIIARML